MSNEHTVKSYEEELQHLTDSVIKMGSLTETQLVDSMDAIIKVDISTLIMASIESTNCVSVKLPIFMTESVRCCNSSSYDFTVCSLLIFIQIYL